MRLDALTEEHPPIPSRMMTFFAPWRWFPKMRPWKKWTITVVALVLWYIKSPVVIVPVVNRITVPYADSVFEVVYAPLAAGYEASPAVEVFYDIQFDAVDGVLSSWGW